MDYEVNRPNSLNRRITMERQNSNEDIQDNWVMVYEEEEEKTLGESWEYLGDPVANEQALQELRILVLIVDDEEEVDLEGVD